MSGLYRSTDFFARVRWIGYGCALLFMGIAGFGINFASNEKTHDLAVAADLVRSLNTIESVVGRIALHSHSGHEDLDSERDVAGYQAHLQEAIWDARAEFEALPPESRKFLQKELGLRDIFEPLIEAASPLLANHDVGETVEPGARQHTGHGFMSEHYFVETFQPTTRKIADAVETVRRDGVETLEFQGQVSLGLMGFMLMAITLFIFVPMEMAIGRTMRQLHDTRRKAEAAHQAKSDFLANMSHEIRTPMNGVMGMAKLLARSELNDKQRTFADIIVKSGNALLTIINDVLDFSKIEAGEVTLDPEPFNLYEAVEDVAALVSAKAEEKGLEIIARIQPDLPEMVVGDAGRVRQVLTNLVGNGVKFTDEGHVLIDVSGAVSSLNSGQAVNLVIKVIDTGIGIPPENVDKVFDKFSQVNASASQRHEGTGLGLTISQRLVELMGGEIGAESVLGEGSTFWFSFSLPIAGEQAEPRAVPARMAGAPVLVVDDNGVNRAALIEQFKSWGLQADGAANGDAAIRALTRAADNDKAYELALVDLDMPDMNGAELASRIRSHDRFGSIAIIMLTSVDAPSAEIDFTSTGIEDQLAKPARTSDLYRSLTTILEKRRANAVPPAAAPPAAVPSAAALPAGGAKNGLRSVHKGTSGKVVQIAVGDQTTQQLVEQALMQADHTFFVVDNSMIAAALVRELQPSLVIAELPGSGEDGMDLVMAVRVAGAETGKQIPFVGLADPADGNTLQWIDAGVTRVVNPPVLPDHLRQMIDSLMQDEEIDLPAAVGA